jgi:hypothetical protein
MALLKEWDEHMSDFIPDETFSVELRQKTDEVIE